MIKREIASLCEGIYYPEHWGVFDYVWENEDVTVGRKGTVLAFRGTDNYGDILRDLEAEPIFVRLVGTVHSGMWQGVRDIFDKIGLKAGDEIELAGHSLGAAHAAMFARLCIIQGVNVRHLLLLSPPKCGYADFHAGLQWVNISAYVNGYDEVPSLPPTLPIAPWQQFPLLRIAIKPDGLFSEINPLLWHDVKLYVRGMV